MKLLTFATSRAHPLDQCDLPRETCARQSPKSGLLHSVWSCDMSGKEMWQGEVVCNSTYYSLFHWLGAGSSRLHEEILGQPTFDLLLGDFNYFGGEHPLPGHPHHNHTGEATNSQKY